MAVLIDTDLLIAAERGDLSGLTAVADEERAVSVITVSELLHGVWRSAEMLR
jgi:predicted nucleic acid-binding protein